MTNSEKLGSYRFLISVLNTNLRSVVRTGKKKDIKNIEHKKDVLMKKIDKLLKII